MIVERVVGNKKVGITLTSDELYKAHREYMVEQYEGDVTAFIEEHLKISVEVLRKDYSITAKDLRNIAELFYDKSLNEISKSYALANAVISYLKDKGVEMLPDVKEFEDSDDMNIM